MDDLDRHMLETLQKDGRVPFTQIAQQAGVSESTVRVHYRALEEAGVVRTVAVVDPYALDFRAPALIGVSVEPGTIEHVARSINELPEVSYLVMTLGSRDLMVEVYCRDVPHLTELVTGRIHGISGVRNTEVLMIARSYKLSYCWSPMVETREE